MSQPNRADVMQTRTQHPVVRQKALRTMKTIDAPSKRLEHLLALIADHKDQGAFAELYTATRRKLFSTVILIVYRQDLAEEILQEAFVRIWSNAGAYRSSRGSAMTWMIAITRNIAIDYIRKPAREAQSDENVLLQLRSDDPSALEVIEAVEDQQTAIGQRQIALAALQALDPARRDLIIAAYIYGESREQLAKARGVPVSTVKTWIRRALLEVEATVRKPGQHVPSGSIATNTTDVRRDAELKNPPRAANSGLEPAIRRLKVATASSNI